MASLAACKQCAEPIPGLDPSITDQFCARCEASWADTRGAICKEYPYGLPLEMAAYGYTSRGVFGYWKEPSDALFGPDDEKLAGGYTCALFGPLRAMFRTDAPFRYWSEKNKAGEVTKIAEIWEARVWLPDKPTAYWQKLWRPDGEREARLVGHEQTVLTAKQRSRFLAGARVISKLPLHRGGRPQRARALTDIEQAELAAYDEQKAKRPHMRDNVLTAYHLKYNYGHLRYLLALRKAFRAEN